MAGADPDATLLQQQVQRLEAALEQLQREQQQMAARLPGAVAEPEASRQGTLSWAQSKVYEEANRSLVEELSALEPLKPLLQDETVNDVLINGTQGVYVERMGKLEKTGITFPAESEVMVLAEHIVKTVGRELNPARPLVDARLLDGSRVNVIAPPLAVDGTTISIRKFSKRDITLDMMVEQENISAQLAALLKIIGKCRLNVIISGGTGSGKTTLLNAISHYVEDKERVVTIEDAAELRLQQPHVVRLETTPVSFANGYRQEEVQIRDLVKNALRMRPDRIIVGEVRGSEAFDMMQAMNTGHEGSLTTIHANHPRDCLARLENMIGMANLGLPLRSIRQQMVSALHVIIQISRMRDGRRRITYVSEIAGIEGDMITMQDLFTFKVKGETPHGGIDGAFAWSGIVPRFVRRAGYYDELETLGQCLGVRLPKG